MLLLIVIAAVITVIMDLLMLLALLKMLVLLMCKLPFCFSCAFLFVFIDVVDVAIAAVVVLSKVWRARKVGCGQSFKNENCCAIRSN